jgi:uncharacterized RDD family membrane protein YckC
VNAIADSTSDSVADTGYASFTRRFRALVIDAAVVAVGLVALVVVSEITQPWARGGKAIRIVFLGLLLLYEPLFVASRGSTIGHSAMNLRVVGPSGGNPSFVRALGRYVVKAVLGLPSFISMMFTRRHQAVHDVVTRTTVQIRDLSHASPDHYYVPSQASTPINELEDRDVAELSPDQLLALSRLDDQMKALKARGFPIGRALASYNSQREAILSGQLTSTDIDPPG